MSVVASKLAPGSRQRVYLILLCVSLICFVCSMWQAYPIVVEPQATLGLGSYLPAAYWVGLALIVVVSILAFLDSELKKDAMFITILIVLGILLVGVPVFGYTNAQYPNQYYFISQASTLLTTHHIDIAHPPTLITYYSWPASHFTSASLLTIAGVNSAFILKYWPLFWLACLVLITYAIGKRFDLPPNRCFLLSFLALASWTTLYIYASNSIGIVLFVLLFTLLLSRRSTVAGTALIIVVFSALVITHGFTSLAVFPALLLFSVYRKDWRLVTLSTLFVVIFAVWYTYMSPPAMEEGVGELIANPFRQILWATDAERYELTSAAARTVARFSQLGRVALWVVLALAGFVLLLARRVSEDHRRLAISVFCWTIGTGLVALIGYGEELNRAYTFCLVPAAGILALCSYYYSHYLVNLVLISAMCFLVAVFPIANYATDAEFGQVLTTELRGAGFTSELCTPVSNRDYYFTTDVGLMYYHKPELEGNLVNPVYGAKSPAEVDLSELDEMNYVIVSKQASDRFVFEWGDDPYSAWPDTEAGEKAALIYDNGDYQIYENYLAN